MSGLDLPKIRLALADRLRSLPGVFVYEQLPGSPQVFPCVVLPVPDSVDYRVTSHRGLSMVTYGLVFLTGRMSPTSQAFLEGLLSEVGELSVAVCLEADRQLGGLVSNLRVTGTTTGMFAVSQSATDDSLGCEIAVEVAC